MGKRNNRFDENWDEDEEYRRKPKHQINKRKEMRMERALKIGDINAYLDEEDDW